MKENRYHIDESKLSGDMVNEPVVAYRDAVAEPMAHHFVSSAALNDEDDCPISKLFSYEEVQKSIDDFIEKKMMLLNGFLGKRWRHNLWRISHGSSRNKKAL